MTAATRPLGADYPPTAMASAVGNAGTDAMVRTMPAPETTKSRSWLTYEHPYYTANKAKWAFALAHYTGEVVDQPQAYLVKRAVGETDEAFKERCSLADYTNHFAEVVESLVGMIYAVEGDANRTFLNDAGTGLGDPADPATPIGRLWRRADAEGNGYLTVYKRLGVMLSITHCCWMMVDVVNGGPVLKVLSPLQVTNWFTDANGHLEVVVREEVDARVSIQQEPASRDQYVHLTVAGWQRYRIDDSGEAVAVGSPGTWRYESPDRGRALPIFRCQLPMIRHVGYQLAKKANAIFNKESERDNLLRTANFPRLVVPATDEQFDTTMARLAEGANAIQEDPAAEGNTRYINPDTASAQVATEVIEKKIGDFKATAHKAYDDGAGGGAQKTATEVRQDVASGTGAYLQLLKAGLDDAENNALWRIEQALYPADRGRWFIAHVDRSDDFLPDDPDEVVERSAAAAWGKDRPVPMGVTALVAIAKEVARHRGAPVDDTEIEAAVQVRAVLDAMETASSAGLTLPAEVRVELLMRIVGSSGLIDPEAEAILDDGSKAKLADVIRQRALESMQAADEAKRRESELLTGSGGPPDRDPEPVGDA